MRAHFRTVVSVRNIIIVRFVCLNKMWLILVRRPHLQCCASSTGPTTLSLNSKPHTRIAVLLLYFCCTTVSARVHDLCQKTGVCPKLNGIPICRHVNCAHTTGLHYIILSDQTDDSRQSRNCRRYPRNVADTPGRFQICDRQFVPAEVSPTNSGLIVADSTGTAAETRNYVTTADFRKSCGQHNI